MTDDIEARIRSCLWYKEDLNHRARAHLRKHGNAFYACYKLEEMLLVHDEGLDLCVTKGMGRSAARHWSYS